ncbi:MAG: hypothetical protein WDO13_08110 [Verrucomicrobiota bacterium]
MSTLFNLSPIAYFQSLAPYCTGGFVTVPPDFINNLMVQLNRRDWPGMPAVSFVDKYGQPECEDLAYNMFFSSTARSSQQPRSLTEGGNRSTEGLADYGMYGTESILTVDGKQRVFGGVGPGLTSPSSPRFSRAKYRRRAVTSSGGDPYATAITLGGQTFYTKTADIGEVGSRGFSPVPSKIPSSSNGPKPVNVEIGRDGHRLLSAQFQERLH